MKEIIKRYYELDDKTKEKLSYLYMFHELETYIPDYENVNLNLGDEEKLLEIAMHGTYLTDLAPDEIIRRTLEILNNKELSIDELNELEPSDYAELIQNTDEETIEDEDNLKIVVEFVYRGLFCVLLKDNDKYILTYEKDNDARVLIFKNIEEILATVIQRDIILSESES